MVVRGNSGLRAAVWKTGQSISHAPGDDGDLQTGLAWPSPRFTDHGDGTVTDNLTGLMWLKNADCKEIEYPVLPNTFDDRLSFVRGMNEGSYPACGSGYNGWRMSNRKELHSLVDFSKFGPPLPAAHPFINVVASHYSCSSTHMGRTYETWLVNMYDSMSGWLACWYAPATGKSVSVAFMPVRDQRPALPDIRIDPPHIDFGESSAGESSEPRVFTVSNAGTGQLLIGSVSMTGDQAGQFVIETDDCSGRSLLPSETCTVSIRFFPITPGRARAGFNIPSNDPYTPVLQTALIGRGTVMKGDVNGDGTLDMDDAVGALKIVSGLSMELSPQFTLGDESVRDADVNGDGATGMAEAIYVLEVLSDVRRWTSTVTTTTTTTSELTTTTSISPSD
jgi:hypothetical protein